MASRHLRPLALAAIFSTLLVSTQLPGSRLNVWENLIPRTEAAASAVTSCTQATAVNSEISCVVYVNRPIQDTGATGIQVGIVGEGPLTFTTVSPDPRVAACSRFSANAVSCFNTYPNSLGVGQTAYITARFRVDSCGTMAHVATTTANSYGVNSPVLRINVPLPACDPPPQASSSSSSAVSSVAAGTAQCSDGVDNDGDGKIDFGGAQNAFPEKFTNAINPDSFIQATGARTVNLRPGQFLARGAKLTADDLVFSLLPGASRFITTANAPSRLGISGVEKFAVTLPSLTYGFAFDMYEPTSQPDVGPNSDGTPATFYDSVFSVTFFNGSSVVDSMQLNSDNAAIRTHEFWSDKAFNRVEIREVSGGIDNEFFGPFYLSTTPRSSAAGDPDCASANDNSEAPAPQCSDGADNDGDGKIDSQDPGCYQNGAYNPADNSETDPVAVTACSDNTDNDGDGLVDLQDPGCSSLQDNDESNAVLPQCSDNIDNDGDDKVDFEDPGCYTNGVYNPNDNDETNGGTVSSSSASSTSSSVNGGIPQCRDGQDNDGDGKVDYSGVQNAFPVKTINAQNADAFIQATGARTVQLRPGVNYAPGAKATADDLVFSLIAGATRFITTSGAPAQLGISGIEKFAITLPSPTYGFAFDMFEPTGPSTDGRSTNATFYDSVFSVTFFMNNSVVDSMQLNSDNMAVRTHGFWSDKPFNRVEVRETYGGIDNEYFGPFYLSTTPRSGTLGDPDCTSPDDNSEGAAPQCSDGMDNDGDGKIDSQDPGCYQNGVYNPNDTSEVDPYVPAACNDGIDNDHDGLTDLLDPGCTGITDNDETNAPLPQCSDGLDNDADGEIDFEDIGCYVNGIYNPNGTSEYNPSASSSSSSSSVSHAQCSDGIDNDFDGAIDTQDSGCYTNGYYDPNDNSEYAAQSSSSSSSSSVYHPQCSDGIDNDNDGAIDFYDSGCYVNGYYDANDNSEYAVQSSSSSSSSSAQINGSFTVNIISNVTNVHVGDTVTYTVVVQNNTANQWNNITVTSPLSQYLIFQGATNGAYLNGSTVTLGNVSFGPYETRTFTFTAQVGNGAQAGAIILTNVFINGVQIGNGNVVTVIGSSSSSSSSSVYRPQCSDGIDNDNDGAVDFYDSDCYVNGYYDANDNSEYGVQSSSSSSSSSSTINGGTFNVNITTNVINVHVGDTVTYTVNIQNLTNVQWNNLTVTDPLSAYLVFQNASNGGYLNGNVITWSNVNIAPYGTQTFTFTVLVGNGAQNGSTITNYVYINGIQMGNPNVITVNGGATLSVSANAPSTVNAGGILPVTVTVLNNGSSNASNVVLTDYLPSGVTLAGNSDASCFLQNGTVTCNLGTLSANQTRVITLNLQTGQTYGSCVPGTLINTFMVRADQGTYTATTTTNTALQCQNAQLTLTVDDGRVTAAPGDTLTYNVIVHNASSVQASNITLTDTLPGQLQFLSGSDAGYVNGQTVTWQNVTVPANGQQTVTLTARISGSATTGILINTLQASANGQVLGSASDATTIVAPIALPSYGGGTFTPQNNAQNTTDQNAVLSNTSVVNAPVQGDNNTVAITTVQQNQNDQYLISNQQLTADQQAQAELNAVQTLPHTGAGDRTGPLENVSRFLLPASAGNAATPAMVWGSMILMGLGFAGRMMRSML
jgi:uncharacterized repeat protein (TIGR01451 family)